MNKIFFIFFLIFNFQFSIAGNNCENLGIISTQSFEKSLNTTKMLINTLEDNNASVAIVGRVGQNLQEYGIKYSHAGFIYKENNQWFAFHELNKCGTNESFIFNEGIGNFFLDNMFSYEAIAYIPSQKIQEKILVSIKNKNFIKFYSKNYNMTAYPFSTQYQNSNQFILESITSILFENNNPQSREDAQSLLKIKNYQPSTFEINMFKRLGGRLFKNNIQFDDQPLSSRIQGKISTISVDSLINFIKNNDTGKIIEITP